jgi:hypothetical protein
MYEVELYDTKTGDVSFVPVPDAIDYEDAFQVVNERYPDYQILGVIMKKPND